MPKLYSNDEAKQLLLEGHRLTHSYFTSLEWIEMEGYSYRFEDGVKCSVREFWLDREDWSAEWSIKNDQK